MELVTTSELVARTSLSRVTLWRYSKKYLDFPKPIVISGLKRWIYIEVFDWLLTHRSSSGEK